MPERADTSHMSEVNDSYRMDSLKVHNRGRITIPAPVRNELDLVDGQLLTLHLLVGDEGERFNASLSDTRARIPQRLRDDHMIEDGDTVDVVLIPHHR